jgi:hypothetical protein
MFVSQNVATWEIVYVHWKACHIYLQMLPSDVSTVDDHLYMKTAVTCSRNARKCHSELCVALGVLQYWTVVRCIQAFKSGRLSTANMQHSRRSVSAQTDMSVCITEQWMDADWCRTVKKLTECTGIPVATVLQILWQNLKMYNAAAKCVPHYFNEMQHWTCYNVISI